MVADPVTRARQRAKRWACRVAAQQSLPDKNRCVRRMFEALYVTLPPKRDGSHPLDADNLKLEG